MFVCDARVHAHGKLRLAAFLRLLQGKVTVFVRLLQAFGLFFAYPDMLRGVWPVSMRHIVSSGLL